MVKPGYSDSSDISTEMTAMRQASAVVRDLEQGKVVAPEAIAAAKEGFINSLSGDKPARAATARDGLITVYIRSTDPAEKAEMIGDLVAIGLSAKPVLEKIGQMESTTRITADELKYLEESLSLPLEQRLVRVVMLLDNEAHHRGSSDGSDPSRGRGFLHMDLPKDPQHLFDEADEPEEPEPAGEGPSRLESRLRNPDLSLKNRLEAARLMGTSAIPILVDWLRSPHEDQQEFATLALNNLGRQSDHARWVYDAARRLETDPELRLTGEYIRKSVEGGGADVDGTRPRQRAQSAHIPDTYLRRVFASADSPNILRAAIGREALAIRIGIKQLHEMRA